MSVFYNQAVLTYNDTTTNSNIVSGEIIEVISATKTAVQSEYSADEPITYLINIVNSSTSSVNGVTISDDLGAYEYNSLILTPMSYEDGSVRYFSNGVLQSEPSVSAGPPFTVSGISIPASGNVLIVYQARPNEFAPLSADSTITNTATISGTTLTSTIEAASTITVQNEGALSIIKSISPSTVVENGQITYTFLIQNNGNADAATTDNVTLSDTFNPILSALNVTFNGTQWTQTTNFTYDEVTGVFTTIPGQITVPAATYTQDPTTGVITVTPGISTLTVTGTV